MKFVKIISAVLFFSFLGNFENQLLAQRPTKNVGYWQKSLSIDEFFENGDYRARIQNNGAKGVNLIIYRSDNGAELRTIFLCGAYDVQYLGFFKLSPNTRQEVALVCSNSYDTDGDKKIIGDLTHTKRESEFGNRPGFKVLDSDTPVDKLAYFQLEADGRFVIYNKLGMFNAAGTPILEF